MTRLLLALAAIAGGLAIAWYTGWIKRDAFASQPIANQRVDAGYQRIYFEAAVLRAGERLAEGHDAYVKAFPREGKLALCGYVVLPSGFIAERTRAWLDAGRLEIAGQRVSSAFVAVRLDNVEAGCAATELPWRDEYRSAALKLTGVPLLDVP